MDWFRMWHGMPNDDKLRVVARKSKQPMALVVAVWSYLLDYASQQEQRGSVAGIDLEAVAVGLDMEEDVVSSIFFCLEEKERIKNWQIVSWEKLQPKREDRSTERVRAHRNAMKRNETQSNAPDTDTDTDTDTEKKEKKKKEIAHPPEGVSLQTWEDFKRLRKDRRATLTDTALNGIKREAEKAGLSLQTALEICCERGWQGFRADWHKKEQPKITVPTPAKEDYEPYARRLREYGIIE